MPDLLPELDAYRLAYEYLPFSKHQAMYRRIGEVYPEQAFWNAEDCAAFLARYRPAQVFELGGHDGGLAAAVLPQATSVEWWLNLEIVRCEQRCDDPRYAAFVLTDWAWTYPLHCDALILSHVIEHLSEGHVRSLIRACHADAVYVDAPLQEHARSSWRGSVTAHILPHSMQELDALFAEQGFSVSHAASSNQHGFECRTRWYERA